MIRFEHGIQAKIKKANAENNFWYINIDLFVDKCWLYVTRHESMYNEIAGANIIEIANKHNYPIYLSYETKDMTALIIARLKERKLI